MAAPSLPPRKTPRSSDEMRTALDLQVDRKKNWPYEHKMTREMQWITASFAEIVVLERLLSLTNLHWAYRRDEKLEQNGTTGIIELAKEAEDSRFSLREWQATIKSFRDDGLITVYSRQEAVREKLFKPKEGGRLRDGQIAIIVHPEKFAERAEQNRQIHAEREAEKARRRAAEEEEEEANRQKRTFKVTRKPIVHEPGKKAQAFDLDDEAQCGLVSAKRLRGRIDLDIPIAIAFKVVDDVLDYSVSHAEPEKAGKRRESEDVTQRAALASQAQNGHQNGKRRKQGEGVTQPAALPEIETPELGGFRDFLDQKCEPVLGVYIDDVAWANVIGSFESHLSLAPQLIEVTKQLILNDLHRGKLYSYGGVPPLVERAKRDFRLKHKRNGSNGNGDHQPPLRMMSRAEMMERAARGEKL